MLTIQFLNTLNLLKILLTVLYDSSSFGITPYILLAICKYLKVMNIYYNFYPILQQKISENLYR